MCLLAIMCHKLLSRIWTFVQDQCSAHTLNYNFPLMKAMKRCLNFASSSSFSLFHFLFAITLIFSFSWKKTHFHASCRKKKKKKREHGFIFVSFSRSSLSPLHSFHTGTSLVTPSSSPSTITRDSRSSLSPTSHYRTSLYEERLTACRRAQFKKVAVAQPEIEA